MKLHKKTAAALDRLMAGRGLALLTVVCVAVITATALWTQHTTTPGYDAAPTSGNLQAAALWQQSLPAASAPTHLPTRRPLLWQAPLTDLNVITPFSLDTMKKSGVTGIWSVHAAVDLAAPSGTPVVAMAPGSILDCADQGLDGAWISVAHADGYVSRYAGLSFLGAFKPGDPINAGQTVGFIGNSVIAEKDLPPHLHLQILHNDQPIDPMALFPH